VIKNGQAGGGGVHRSLLHFHDFGTRQPAVHFGIVVPVMVDGLYHIAGPSQRTTLAGGKSGN